MTRPSPSSIPPLLFEQGTDGRWRAGPYTLGPGVVGFGIKVMDIFRDGIHVRRTAGERCLPDAIAWAQHDAAEAAAPGRVVDQRERAVAAGQAALL